MPCESTDRIFEEEAIEDKKNLRRPKRDNRKLSLEDSRKRNNRKLFLEDIPRSQASKALLIEDLKNRRSCEIQFDTSIGDLLGLHPQIRPGTSEGVFRLR